MANASPRGFEPLASRLGILRSIRLSYGDERGIIPVVISLISKGMTPLVDAQFGSRGSGQLLASRKGLP